MKLNSNTHKYPLETVHLRAGWGGWLLDWLGGRDISKIYKKLSTSDWHFQSDWIYYTDLLGSVGSPWSYKRERQPR